MIDVPDHRHVYKFTPLIATMVYKQPEATAWLIEQGAALPPPEG